MVVPHGLCVVLESVYTQTRLFNLLRSVKVASSGYDKESAGTFLNTLSVNDESFKVYANSSLTFYSMTPPFGNTSTNTYNNVRASTTFMCLLGFRYVGGQRLDKSRHALRVLAEVLRVRTNKHQKVRNV